MKWTKYPEVLTDKAWKKVKSLLTTKTDIGKVLRDAQKAFDKIDAKAFMEMPKEGGEKLFKHYHGKLDSAAAKLENFGKQEAKKALAQIEKVLSELKKEDAQKHKKEIDHLGKAHAELVSLVKISTGVVQTARKVAKDRQAGFSKDVAKVKTEAKNLLKFLKPITLESLKKGKEYPQLQGGLSGLRSSLGRLDVKLPDAAAELSFYANLRVPPMDSEEDFVKHYKVPVATGLAKVVSDIPDLKI